MIHIRKRLKEHLGGGRREFVYDDVDCYAGVENRAQFLTSQERSTIVEHFLEGVRTGANDSLCGMQFREGQSIGEL